MHRSRGVSYLEIDNDEIVTYVCTVLVDLNQNTYKSVLQKYKSSYFNRSVTLWNILCNSALPSSFFNPSSFERLFKTMCTNTLNVIFDQNIICSSTVIAVVMKFTIYKDIISLHYSYLVH
jgi:hypothetical protein